MTSQTMKDILKRTEKPASYPITVAEAKANLRKQTDEEDTLIEALIAAATDYLDVPNGVIGKALITQTWTLSRSSPDRNDEIELPVTPVQSISSIRYFDDDNEAQEMDLDDVQLFSSEHWAVVETKKWPRTRNRRDAITIEFVAGFGGKEDVPESIRQAIKLLVAHWYEHRMAVSDLVTAEVPLSAQTLIDINR